MFKRLLQHFIDRVVKDNRGQTGSAMGYGGEISGDYGQTSKKFTETGTSKKKMETAASEFVQAPEFAESEAARGKWWDLLQGFGGQEGYGAISPDWGNIWENAQRKVQQYFWGSPTDPGVVGKIKASAARRNVSESPALTNMMARMGATEANVMSDMATQQATQQAEFGEAGRLNYLTNLSSLSGFNPQGTFYTPWQKTQEDYTRSGTEQISQWGVGGKIKAGT